MRVEEGEVIQWSTIQRSYWINGPGWKGKGSAAKALGDPVSKTVSQFQSSLIVSEAQALLSSSNVLRVKPISSTALASAYPLSHLTRTSNGFNLAWKRPFFLSYSLKCLDIVNKDKCLMNDQELWQYMISKKPAFYKAYCHLTGVKYGIDFVAYRHHPALLHSEFTVLVLLEGDGCANEGLRLWSDIHCPARLCGGVVKTLLVLEINKNGHGVGSPSCVEECSVSESTTTGWLSERCREDHNVVKSDSSNCRTSISETPDENKQD